MYEIIKWGIEVRKSNTKSESEKRKPNQNTHTKINDVRARATVPRWFWPLSHTEQSPLVLVFLVIFEQMSIYYILVIIFLPRQSKPKWACIYFSSVESNSSSLLAGTPAFFVSLNCIPYAYHNLNTNQYQYQKHIYDVGPRHCSAAFRACHHHVRPLASDCIWSDMEWRMWNHMGAV